MGRRMDERNAEIWRLRKEGMTLAEIGEKYGIGRQRVHSICRREEWSERARERREAAMPTIYGNAGAGIERKGEQPLPAKEAAEAVEPGEDLDATRVCAACGRELPIDEFQRSKGGSRYSDCRACSREKRLARRAAERAGAERPEAPEPPAPPVPEPASEPAPEPAEAGPVQADAGEAACGEALACGERAAAGGAFPMWPGREVGKASMSLVLEVAVDGPPPDLVVVVSSTPDGACIRTYRETGEGHGKA